VQLLAARHGHHDLARLQPGDQRRVLGRDAELTEFTGGHDQLGLATEDLGLGADDVATDGAAHDLLLFLVPLSRSRERTGVRASRDGIPTTLTLTLSRTRERGWTSGRQLLRLLDGLVDRADHAERLLRQVVVVAVA